MDNRMIDAFGVETMEQAAAWLEAMDEELGRSRMSPEEQWKVALQDAVSGICTSSEIYRLKGTPDENMRALDGLSATLLMLSLRVARLRDISLKLESWHDVCWQALVPSTQLEELPYFHLINWQNGRQEWVREAVDMIVESLAIITFLQGPHSRTKSGYLLGRVRKLLAMAIRCGPAGRTAANRGYAGVGSPEFWVVEPLRQQFIDYQSSKRKHV